MSSSVRELLIGVAPSRRRFLRAGLGAVAAVASARCAAAGRPSTPSPARRPVSEVAAAEAAASPVEDGDARATPVEPPSSPPDEAADPPERHPRPLLARFPALAAALPWLDLGGLPTPVTEAASTARCMGLEGLWIKRDDEAGAVYGGSKARKLEHLLADARREGSGEVLTFGGVGSNHALATAVHARRLGLDCVLVLLPERPSEHAREHLLIEHHLGCEQLRGRGVDEAALREALARRPGSSVPYVIPAGGTSPLGNVGYVNAGFELAEQCADGLLPVPDEVWVAAGTTGTAAGLYIGLRAAGLPTRLVAVRASNPGTGNLRRLSSEVAATVELLRSLDPEFPEVAVEADRLRVEMGFAGAGYAIPSDAGRRALAFARAREGLTLDPTYTAKAFAALLAGGAVLRGHRVLFWNTYDPRTLGRGDSQPADLPGFLRGYFGRSTGRRAPD